jgi:hypothetical protein
MSDVLEVLLASIIRIVQDGEFFECSEDGGLYAT